MPSTKKAKNERAGKSVFIFVGVSGTMAGTFREKYSQYFFS